MLTGSFVVAVVYVPLMRVCTPARFTATPDTVYVFPKPSGSPSVHEVPSSERAPATFLPSGLVKVSHDRVPPSAVSVIGSAGATPVLPSAGVPVTVAAAIGKLGSLGSPIDPVASLVGAVETLVGEVESLVGATVAVSPVVAAIGPPVESVGRAPGVSGATVTWFDAPPVELCPMPSVPAAWLDGVHAAARDNEPTTAQATSVLRHSPEPITTPSPPARNPAEHPAPRDSPATALPRCLSKSPTHT